MRQGTGSIHHKSEASSLAQTMITWALIASAVIALVLVVLVQGKWTRRDSWFAAVFAQPSWLW